LGGLDLPENIVRLTFREHFIVHWLLTKFTVGQDRKRMYCALIHMGRQHSGRLISSWQYNLIKQAAHKAFKGQKLSEETKKRLSNIAKGNKHRLGKKHSVEVRAVISKKRMGFKESPERVEQKRQAMYGNKIRQGSRHTEETRVKMRMSHMARPYKDRAVWLGKKLSPGHRLQVVAATKRRHAINRLLKRCEKRFSKQIPNQVAPDKVDN
jgi:hypothetical protein